MATMIVTVDGGRTHGGQKFILGRMRLVFFGSKVLIHFLFSL
jgi:hypothetical protein